MVLENTQLLEGPCKDLQEVIRKELGENPDRLETNLKVFEEWISCQRHLPTNYDKGMLLYFLRGCKHDLREAKRKFELYFVGRTTIPEIYCNRKTILESNQNAAFIKNNYVMAYPKLTDSGYRISAFGLFSENLDNFSVDWQSKLIWMMADYRLVHDNMVAGDIFIFDARNFTVAHTSKFITSIFQKTINLAQNTYPLRIREMHVINAKSYMDHMISAIKLLLKEKLRQRLIVHRGTDTLKDHIPLKCLPSDFGGSLKSINELKQDWDNLLREKLPWYTQQESVKCSEPIPTDLKEKFVFNEEEMEGTFRKLQID